MSGCVSDLIQNGTPEASRINEVLKKKALAPIDAPYDLVSRENRTAYDPAGMNRTQRAVTTTVMVAAFGILAAQPAMNYSQTEGVPTTVTQAACQKSEPLVMFYGAQDSVMPGYCLPQAGLSAELREAFRIEIGVRTNIERLVEQHQKKQAPKFQDAVY